MEFSTHSIAGRGCVAGLIGAPGIGKTRLVRELASIANELGVEVHSTFCEAHETEVPFHVLGRMVEGGVAGQRLGRRDRACNG